MNDPTTPAASDWHLREADDVARAHAVELHRGLHDEEAARRAVLHGPNELVERARRSPWKLMLGQFTDFMIPLRRQKIASGRWRLGLRRRSGWEAAVALGSLVELSLYRVLDPSGNRPA